ncbi:nitroreductase family protein [Candidatus Methylospira mobilis]|uniref:Nitroreductase family protein n=1 Tax=Candidatus Methylospira mobilis TaxID=1808979 RepID=A0A5Q0BLT1_9GAMM|nr:nitroreductase family protein [Candidatus Methylospira mobilis]QFY42716.1 nitroreductase family protein [Candidatus Methylospira mobilis]WNV04162.1 nitroreductase family protein [Candidatus Methylospira mobilis]
MSELSSRKPLHDIEPVFISRWSTKALSGEPISDDTLFKSFEAARWAPSGSNSQPWRFIYSKRDSESWPRFLELVNERNRVWAANASALILLLSKKNRETPEGARPLRSHSFDAGAAWSNFANQTHLSGWSTRAIGGFDRDGVRSSLSIPDEYEIEVVIAVGKPADNSVLPEPLQSANKPSGRVPLSDLVADGRFAFAGAE